MGRITIREWYDRLPELRVTTPATPDELKIAARRLFRFATKQTFKGSVEITSGNRYTWIRRGTMYVNPADGWGGLARSLSWWVRPGTNRENAKLQIRLRKEIIKRGWLNGALKERKQTIKPRKSPIDPDQKKLDTARAALTRWQAKLKRAQTGVLQTSRKVKYYEKKLAARREAILRQPAIVRTGRPVQFTE